MFKQDLYILDFYLKKMYVYAMTEARTQPNPEPVQTKSEFQFRPDEIGTPSQRITEPKETPTIRTQGARNDSEDDGEVLAAVRGI